MIQVQTKINPILFVIRVLFCFGFFYVLILVGHRVPSKVAKEGSVFLIFALLYMFIIVSMIVLNFNQIILLSKKYIVTNEKIEQFNYLRNNKRDFPKESISGFSKSTIPFTRWLDSPILIVYLKNGEKLLVLKQAYFNFDELEETLNSAGYKYLGQEPYKWKWFDRREYLYEQ